MWHEHLRTLCVRDEPVARQRDSSHSVHLLALRFLPALKIDCAGKRRKHQKLSELQPCSLRQLKRGVECLLAIAREAEDKRAQHVYAMLTKFLQLAHQVFSRPIEILVNGLQ